MSTKKTRSVVWCNSPVVNLSKAANKILETGIDINDSEFNAMWRPKLIHVDAVQIGYTRGPEYKQHVARIFGSPGTITFGEAKIESVYQLYVRYKYNLWSVSDIGEAMGIIDAIRRHEIREQLDAEAATEKYEKQQKLKAKKSNKLKVA